jgi:NAD(P)-dependent dehydrogenase (short-subunit alcohol dehydrogenase family)
MTGSGRLVDQVAIVTGGGGGIGRAVCESLAAEGAAVVIVDLDRARIDELLPELSPSSSTAPLGLALDVSREEDMAEMARRVLDRFGRIDVLIACAGILRGRGSLPKPVTDVSSKEWDEVLSTNLKGVFLSNRAVLPTMLRQRSGNIVNLSSTAGRRGRAHDGPYCASKFGVIGLSEALAEEVRHSGVRVQVILPDAVDTPIWDQNGSIRPEQALAPARVADLILYLVTLPDDTVVLGPVIAPFRTRRRARPTGQGSRSRPQSISETGQVTSS